MVCVTTVALGLLAVPTIVWLLTYFGENVADTAVS